MWNLGAFADVLVVLSKSEFQRLEYVDAYEATQGVRDFGWDGYDCS